MIVFIDSGVIGLLSNPNDLEEAIACENWLYTMLLRGVSVYSSDLCDYEVRRSLVLASQSKSDWQTLREESPGRSAVIATTNVKHLSRFAEAQLWRNIL